MPNTRDIKHYEVYTIRRHWSVKRKEMPDLVNMEELAIFDDKALAEAYKAQLEANPAKKQDTTSESFEIQATWVELVPAQENFSLPFNPTYEVEVKKPKVVRERKIFAPKEE